MISGFIATAPPKSVVEAVLSSHDRLKTITKVAVENYIRSFLDTGGPFRQTIEAVAKGSLQYITDKSFDPKDDVTKRATALARLFNDVREKVPSILIVDAGMQSLASGLFSGLTHALIEFEDNAPFWKGWFNKQFRVPLTIAVLTSDQDSTDQLMEIIELQLNNLRQIVGGSEIRSPNPQDSWAVRLPLEWGISGTSGVNITEDPKDQLWFANIDITVDAEDTFGIKVPFDMQINEGQFDNDLGRNGRPNQSDLSATVPPVINAPATIQINTPVVISIERVRDTHRVVIDQPAIATYDASTQTVTPRQLGTFNIMVLDLVDRLGDGSPRAMAPTVAAQQLVTVTL